MPPALFRWPDPADTSAVASLYPLESHHTYTAPDGREFGVVSEDAILHVYAQLVQAKSDAVARARSKMEKDLADITEKYNSAYAEGTQIQNLLKESRERVSELKELISELRDNKSRLAKRVEELEKRAVVADNSPGNNNQGDNTTLAGLLPATLNLLDVLKREKALVAHRPQIYNGHISQIAVVDFLDACETFVEVGAGGGSTRDNRCIDVAIRHAGRDVRAWLKESWARRFKDGLLPVNFNFDSTWADFRAVFMEKWVSTAARTITRTEFANLKYSGDPVAFNEKCKSYLRILTNGTPVSEIGRDNNLFDIYVQKLPIRTADNIGNSAQVQNNLAGTNGPHYTLADAMHAFENSVAMANAKVISHASNSSNSTYLARPIVASAPVDPDAMDLSVLQRSSSTDKCYKCSGLGHHANRCPTPDRRSTDRRQNENRRQIVRFTPGRGSSRGNRGGSLRGSDGQRWRFRTVNVLEEFETAEDEVGLEESNVVEELGTDEEDAEEFGETGNGNQ
jgi:hypothetical protein